MTKILRYTGSLKNRIKLGDFPGYDGQPVEVILDPAVGTITVSTTAAALIMEQYPGVFVDLADGYPTDPPVIDSNGVMTNQPGDDLTEPPPERKRR